MKSYYKFFLQVQPSLQSYLVQEMKNLNFKTRKIQGLNEIQVIANFEGFFKILHHSRIIENIKIQIGKDFLARGDKEIDRGLQQQPFQAFIPVYDLLLKYDIPQVRAKSIQSIIYHERKLKEIIEKFLRLIAIKKEYKELKQIGFNNDLHMTEQLIKQKQRNINLYTSQIKRLVNKDHEEESKRKLISNNNQIQQKHTNIEEDNKNSVNFNKIGKEKDVIKLLKQEQQIQKELGSQQFKQQNQKLSDLVVYLQRNKMSVLLQLNDDNMHKHGDKQQVNYAPIKENLAVIVAQQILKILQNEQFNNSEIKQEEQIQQQEVKIWDPFCGSGTLLLQFLSMYFDVPIRLNFDTTLISKMPVFPNQLYVEYKQNLLNECEQKIQSVLNQKIQNFKVIGSDISSQYVDYTSNNFQSSFINKIIEKNKQNNEKNDKNQIKNQQMNAPPHLNTYSYCDNKIQFINADFESTYKNFIKDLSGFIIVGNLPYGKRSSEKMQQQTLEVMYERFIKLINQNLRKLKGVFIYMNLPENKLYKSHFIVQSKLPWKLVDEFSQGSFKVGLFELDIEKAIQQRKLKEKNVTYEIVLAPEYQIKMQKLNQNIPNSIIPHELKQELVLADQKRYELVKQQEKKEFLERFKSTEYLKTEIKKRLGKHLVRKTQMRQFVRKVIHSERLDMVKRKKMNSYLKSVQEHQTEEQMKIIGKIERNRLDAAKTLVKESLKGLSPEEQQQKFIEIQESLEKAENKKEQIYQQKKQKKQNLLKIPKW